MIVIHPVGVIVAVREVEPAVQEVYCFTIKVLLLPVMVRFASVTTPSLQSPNLLLVIACDVLKGVIILVLSVPASACA